MTPYFATCARGLEPILAVELRRIKARRIRQARGGVNFLGDRATLYQANLHLRTAVRVLLPILEADVHSPDELYDAVRTLDWPTIMTPEQTLAVDCNVRDSKITHSQYASRRVKDAICDQFRERCGRRPSVDPKEPMVGLNLHISKNHATLSLDSSGMSLHKRGYRPVLTRAPLNEALAAGLLLKTGWDGSIPLIDPMCGSGTFPIEACWIALNRPPGLTRKRFGFMGWLDFDRAMWAEIRDRGRAEIHPELAAPILGYDLRRDAIEFSRKNAAAAGVGHQISFQRQELSAFVPPEGVPGLLICNPPYGERIGEKRELSELYRTLGTVLRERCAGWSCWVFAPVDAPVEAVELPISTAVPFFNGRLECKLFEFSA